jgi:hypothetical protein
MSNNSESSVIFDPHAEQTQNDVEVIQPHAEETAEETQSQSHVEVITPETALSVRTPTTSGVQDFGEKLSQFIEKLPGQIAAIYEAYQRPINIVGVLFLSLLTVAIASGILRVLNALPLVAPSLELVGLGYIGWFAWRYLLYADNRQELATQYRNAKQKMLGHDNEAVDQP